MKIYKILLMAIFIGFGLLQINAQTCATAPIGLVSSYSGDNNALDGRSRNNGTIQNNVTYAVGNVGQAFQLGGVGNGSNSGDRVIVGNPANLRLQTFTFEAWVKRSSSTILTNSPFPGFPNGTIFAFGTNGWAILIDQPTNRLALSKANVDQINSNFTITDTNWHHIAVSISGSQAVFYLDGVADTPIAYTSTFAFTTSAAIGARGDNEARNAFFGAIDELAVYNRVLSASEIAAIFNAGTVGKCKPLATVVPENQVLWLAGDGDALDSSGNGNNGTPFNGVPYAVGKVGQTFSFDGFDDYIQTPTMNLGANYSLEFWIKPMAAGNPRNIISNDFRSTTNYGGLYFYTDNAGAGHLEYYVSNQVTANTATAAGGVPTNAWSHIGLTYDGSVTRLYINGILAATGAPHTETFNNSIVVGSGNNADASYFPGSLDEIGLYNRTISALEIESIANAGLAGKYKVQSTVPTGLVAWFAGDGNANDISGNGNNATLAGGANTPTFTTAYVGQGFNHSGLQYATIPDSAAFRPQSFTIEGWANTTNSVGTKVFFGKPFGNLSFNSYALFQQNANLGGVVCDSVTCSTITAPISNNVWHHIAFSFDDPGGAATKTARLYLDGVLVASTTTTIVRFFDTRPAIIGADINNGAFSEGWNGGIDEISFYNRALSVTEIRDQFYAGSGGKYKGAINPAVSNTTKTGEATLTFGTITTSGAVHLTPIDLTSYPALPMGTNTNLNFDVSTTAIYTNPTVCFNMSAFTPAQFANLRVLHLESGAWVNRTAGANTYPNLCSSGLTSLSPFAIAQVAPVAANVAVGGRVTVGKNGLSRARVTLTDFSGSTRTVQTSAFGYYRFDDLEAGATYIVSVNHKRYIFVPQVVSASEDITELNFTAEP